MRERCRRAVAVVGVAAAAVSAACGGGGSDPADEVLSAADESLAGLRSGTIDLSIQASASEPDDVIGVSVSGPFALPEPGELAVADLEVIRTLGTDELPARFVSTGEEAFVMRGEEACRLDAEATTPLMGSDDAPALELELEEWFDEATVERPGTVRGTVDVAKVLPDLFTVAWGLGADVPSVDDDAARELAQVTRSAEGMVRVDEGGELAEVTVDLRFAPEPGAVPSELEQWAAAGLSMRLALSEVNEDMAVAPPTGSAPACRA